MARVRAPGIYNTNGIWQIGPMIIKWGTEEQQERWLPSILTADEHWCQGFSEPEAGSDLANMRTMAIADGDHYVVNGQKTWISSAHLAQWGLFLLRTDPTAFERGAKHEGITAFIVDMRTPGIECRPIRDITGDTMLNEVWFTDAVLPIDCRLGGEGEGWQVAMSTLGHERVGTAGLSITMAADLKNMISTAHAVNPDALRDPELRDRIARAFADIELTRLLNYRALTKIIKGQPNWPEVPLAKLQWSKISQTLAELAVDLLGPAGVLAKGGPDAIDGGTWTRNYSWQRYTSIGAGATEIQKNIIAKKAIRLPRGT
jgi:alkylation response protein AidB-like acyl-CoA dehydrogenase